VQLTEAVSTTTAESPQGKKQRTLFLTSDGIWQMMMRNNHYGEFELSAHDNPPIDQRSQAHGSNISEISVVNLCLLNLLT